MISAKSLLSSVSAVANYATGYLAVSGPAPGNLPSKEKKKTNFIPLLSSLGGGAGAFEIDRCICFFYLPLVYEVFGLQTTLASR